MLTSAIVIQGKKFVSNMARRVLRPRPGLEVTVEHSNDGKPLKLTATTADGFKAVEITLLENNRISFVINHLAAGRTCPLNLLFQYVPEKPFALIHEVMEGSNDRVKEFYLKVWFGDEVSSDIIKIDDMHYKFTYKGQEVSRKDIVKFCQTVGNQSERYVDRNQEFVYAPMDFAIRVGWVPIIQAIFPKFLNGNILNLVHLSNGFRMVEGAEPLRSGQVVDTVVKITGITNIPAGKRVDVIGTLLRDGKPVIEVKSAFLYRGEFNDYDLTFQTTQETPIEVTYATTKSIAVLQSKEWFVPHSNTHHELVPGSKLVFRLNTKTKFRDAKYFSSITTTGKVFMQVSTKQYEEIAVVDYESGDSLGNPVIEYLNRVGNPIEQAHYFENGGYSVMPSSSQLSSVVHAPSSNEAYSLISGDLNPIHTNPFLSDYADLPGTITHGMWTSASTRKFVETFAAENHPERIASYEVDFMGMVLPGDRLETKLFHVGMKNGRKLIRVETFNQNGEKVLQGFAEVDQPLTGYTFTGQGSQEQGMGMDLYAKSDVARTIWDAADSHMLKAYGFSIIDIVRNNPKEKTIHFGGPKGKEMRDNYRSMTYDTVDASGSVKSLPLFPEITETSSFYTFKSPNGLLSSTQFTQPALLLFELAAFSDMQAKQLIQQGAPFAGHSLGEYGALSAVGKFVPVESVVEIGFYRGMTMQVAVERDEQNRSQYGMVAANPARVGGGFNEEALKYVVDSIRHHTKGLLEIVNYNVENWQYVVSGELRLLSVLGDVLSFLNMQKIHLSKLILEVPMEQVQEKLAEIISNCVEKADKDVEQEGFLKLKPGKATIPLPGIDVPFHSTFLLPGVGPFRNFLMRKMNISDIDVSRLRSYYIPNLTARPFDITKDYFQEVFDLTQSTRVSKVLRDWDDEKVKSPSEQQRLAYILLVE
ncbi:fatty acid synthase alpha subunit Lsd1, partial [Mycoemilia scoparia]